MDRYKLSNARKDINMNEPLNHTVKDINGSVVDLNQYKGNY